MGWFMLFVKLIHDFWDGPSWEKISTIKFHWFYDQWGQEFSW